MKEIVQFNGVSYNFKQIFNNSTAVLYLDLQDIGENMDMSGSYGCAAQRLSKRSNVLLFFLYLIKTCTEDTKSAEIVKVIML